MERLLEDHLGGALGVAGEGLHVLGGDADGEDARGPLGVVLGLGGLGVGEALLGLGEDHVVEDVEREAVDVLVGEDLGAEVVDDGPLAVHHVVVLERALADGEVALLDAALGALDGVVEPAVLDGLALLHAEARHDAGDAVGAEEAHQVVLERDVEARGAGVALAGATAAQLAVDAAGLVALGADDVEAARALLEEGAEGLGLAGCECDLLIVRSYRRPAVCERVCRLVSLYGLGVLPAVVYASEE